MPSRRTSGPKVAADPAEPAVVVRPDAGPDLAAGSNAPRPLDPPSEIDIRWSDAGSCTVELRGRPTRAMLAEVRDILWSRTPQDRLTVVVTDAVLSRSLFALLFAGRRRLSASGVFEIVGLDAVGARHIANSSPSATNEP